MSSVFRKLAVMGAGAALLLGATAGLSAASSSNKTYTLAVSPGTLPYSPSTETAQFTATFKDTTPSASINSLTLTAPTGYTVTTAPSLTASSGNLGNNYSVSVSSTLPSTITVTNLYPVGYNQTLTLAFTATVDTSSLTCSNNVGTWSSNAWTGSNQSGAQFAPASATTTVGAALAGSTSYPNIVTGVTVTNNATTCALVGISRSGNSVTVLKPAGSTVNVTVDVLWNAEPAVYPLPATQVDTPSPTHDIQWCGGTSSSPTMPTGEVSCLISESSQIAGSNTVQVHDVIALDGDWTALR